MLWLPLVLLNSSAPHLNLRCTSSIFGSSNTLGGGDAFALKSSESVRTLFSRFQGVLGIPSFSGLNANPTTDVFAELCR